MMTMKWTKCSEEMPSKNDFYLVSVGQPWLIPRFRWVDKAYYCDGKWLGIPEDAKVFAWLPLPQYEETDND